MNQKDDSKSKRAETGVLDDVQLSHKRKYLRLVASVVVVLSSMAAIFLLVLAPAWLTLDGESVRLAISSFLSIATLALGFIAGSNIES